MLKCEACANMVRRWPLQVTPPISRERMACRVFVRVKGPGKLVTHMGGGYWGNFGPVLARKKEGTSN